MVLSRDIEAADMETKPRLPLATAEDLRQLPSAADQFSWTPSQKAVAHRNMHHLYASDCIRPSSNPYHLRRREPLGNVDYRFDGQLFNLDAFFERNNATGLLVLQDGEIALERYARGNTETTLWASRSVAKSFTSTLMGMAVKDGAISSLSDLVTDYVPELRGTLYERVTLRQNLQMTSGQPHANEFPTVIPFHECTVRGDEIGCFVRELRSFARITPDVHQPGERFAYHSADVIVSGLAISRATGQTLAGYLENKIWHPFGMEGPAAWNLEAPGGSAFANSGISATLRDWARFGQLMLREGVLSSGSQQLPSGWVQEATTPSIASSLAGTPYGYNWWLPSASTSADMGGDTRAYWARGSAGQRILISPTHRAVIVKWAVWDNPPSLPSGSLALDEDDHFFSAVLRQLQATTPHPLGQP